MVANSPNDSGREAPESGLGSTVDLLDAVLSGNLFFVCRFQLESLLILLLFDII